MNKNKKNRKQKLVGAIFPFFGDLSTCVGGDEYALSVCRHLQAMKEHAIEDKWIASFIGIWHAQYPEEDSLTNNELLWALNSIDAHFAGKIKEANLTLIATNHPAAKLKLVHGGLSETPDIPYVNLNRDLQVHEFADF
ncbi:MAG: hypothetical protein AB8B64_19760 [Granulosicoccus sp.]